MEMHMILVQQRQMSRVMRKSAFCICEYKAADQLCGNPAADQCLCFCFKDSSIPLLSKSGNPSVAVQPKLSDVVGNPGQVFS